MARAINVLLEVFGEGEKNKKTYDLNSMGLIDFSFNRYLGNPNNIKTGILSEFTLNMMDATGYSILSILQKNRTKMRLKYGFSDKLSPLYILTVTKLNTTLNAMGIMVSIGGIGSQVSTKFPSALFAPGTSIEKIVRDMAKRNNWYVGDDSDKSYVNCDIKLNQYLLKTQDESDYDFIVNKLKPLANKTVSTIRNANETVFWEVNLVPKGAMTELYFRPSTQRGITRRVWKYEYGTSTNSKIISLTNKINMAFLVDGLTLQIPVLPERLNLQSEESLKEEIESIVESKLDVVENIIEKYNLISLDPSDLKWKIELYAAEDVGDLNYEDRILKRLEDVMSTLNKIELEVEGNPDILPTDLIELTVKHRDGNYNMITSSTTGGSYWKVILINESIGQQGYTTNLELVRETVNIL
jgi:hypothetical protein